LPNEDQNLDSLRPGSREMEEGCRWEGQNCQQLKKVQGLEEEEKKTVINKQIISQAVNRTSVNSNAGSVTRFNGFNLSNSRVLGNESMPYWYYFVGLHGVITRR
jgi:hypothetical protein